MALLIKNGRIITADADAAKTGHVIIIGVDGLSPDGVIHAATPTLDDMMANGSWSLHARGVLPTTSGARQLVGWLHRHNVDLPG